MVVASEMVSACLVPAGAERGNWSHAKKIVSHPAVPQVSVNLLLANLPTCQPAFQQLLALVLSANPFAPAQPAMNLALVSLLAWLAHANPLAWNLPVVRQIAVKPASTSKAPAKNLSLCPDHVRQLVANRSAVTLCPASHPALR